jgi:uncharacterized protein (TIGR03437 family)
MYFSVFALLLAASLQAQDLTEINRILDEMSQKLGTGASLVIQQNGTTIFSRSTVDSTPARTINIASASKWLSGFVLMTVVDEGKLSLDDTVDLYLPDFRGSTGKATVRQLFSMTSGFGPTDPSCVNDRRTTLEECAKQIATVAPAVPPGTGFIYGSTGMQLAARIAEIATGKRWADLFRERLVLPLGLTGTRVTLLQADSNPLIAGGCVSNATDYQRVLNVILNGGVHEGRRILSSKAIDAMLADQTRGARIIFSPYSQYDATQPGSGGTRYGIGNWQQTVSNNVLEESSSTGAFGFTPWIDYTRNLTGVLSILNDNPDVFPYYVRIREVLRTQIPSAKLIRRGVTNAANYSSGKLVPGEIATLLGDAIGATSPRVTISGLTAPILAASRNQLSIVVPFELAGRSGVDLKVNDLPSIVIPFETADPGLFTLSQDGTGLAAALNQPTAPGDIVVLYLTGTGALNPPGSNTGPATASLKQVVGKVEVEIDGRPAEVLYAGPSPGSIESLTQINARVPLATRSGNVSVKVRVDGIPDAGNALIAIR